jgi:hypothetical protein
MEEIKRRILRDIERLNGCYDPLIITLNNNKFWSDSYDMIYCLPLVDIDETYLRKGRVEKDPTTKMYSSGRTRITSKVKYVRLEIERRRAWYNQK